MYNFGPKPDFSFEKRYWRKGYLLVIGVDEVGRGAFAGPVVAAAAAMGFRNYDLRFKKKDHKSLIINHKPILKLGIDDSKKLSPKRRKELTKEIRKYFYWGIGEGSVGEINRLGIVKATEKAMRRAIKALIARKFEIAQRAPDSKFEIPKRTTFVLVDAFHVKYITGVGLNRQQAIIHGDSRSISIAAASIMAKVYRDKLMRRLSKKYVHYHWERNKGYGTDLHERAIAKYGVSKLHRKLFVANFIA